MQYERIGKWGRRIVVGVVVVLAAMQVAGWVRNAPGVGYWRSPADRDAYAQARAEVLAALPAPDASIDVPTRCGTVRVLRWGAAHSGVPVVLLPGRGSGAAMWAENLPGWIGSRTIYAVDALGDAGFSAQSLPLASEDDQVAWIAEMVAGLGEERVHLVGHSFGGATAAAVAMRRPENVASLTLLEPVMVIEAFPPSVYFWATLLLLPTPQSWKDHALARIGGTEVGQVQERSPMSRLIDAGTSGYSAALPTPTRRSDEQWRGLAMPVRLDIGGDSDLAGGVRAAERIRALLPTAEVTVWPGGTHSLPMDEVQAFAEVLPDFWARHD